MFIDTRFHAQVLDAVAKLIRNLPGEIEAADVSENLMRALDHIDAARSKVDASVEMGRAA